MPYCQRCSSRCELTNIQPTPSPYIQQGNCTKCHSVVYFFTNTSSGAPTTPTRIPSRVAKKPTTAPRPVRRAPWAGGGYTRGFLKVPRQLYMGLAALSFIILLFFVGQSQGWWGPSVPAIVSNDSTLLRITNTDSTAWNDLKLTLNSKYTFVPVDPNKPVVVPAHATYYFAYSRFMQGEKAFDPSSETPKQVVIEANVGTNHAIKGSARIQAKSPEQ